MINSVAPESSPNTKFPSPPIKEWNAKRAPIKAQIQKDNIRNAWRQFVKKAMAEEAIKRNFIPGWWKKFCRSTKELNYGGRVSLFKELSNKMFPGCDYLEVLSFLFLYEGLEGKAMLTNVVAVQETKPDRIKISARNVVKLKCIAGGSWNQFFKYKGGLQKISNNQIQFATRTAVVDFKQTLKCPRIYKFNNPATGASGGRYCKFSDILEFTYSNPAIVKHMEFSFDKVMQPNDGGDAYIVKDEPRALYAIYADGSKQTKITEITNFVARNLNLGRITRDPCAMQIILLDTAKECTQFFDAAFICALNEGITDATTNGVWVICTEQFVYQQQSDEEEFDEGLEKPAPCKLCALGNESCKRNGIFGEQFYHKICFSCFHIFDRKAMNLIRPVKPCVCHICLEELKSVSWQECFKSKEEEPAEGARKNSKKRRGSFSSTNLKIQKIGLDIGDRNFLAAMHDLYVTKDTSFRKNLKDYSQTVNLGIGVDDYHQVDLNVFKKSPQYAKFVAECGDLFSSYFSDTETPLAHHLTDTLHLLICCMTTCMTLLIIAAQRVESVHPGLGIHALCHALRSSGFHLLAKFIENDAKLKYGDKLKTLITAESGSVCETISFDKATVIEFKKYLSKKTGGAGAERVAEIFKNLKQKTTSNPAAAKVSLSAANTKSAQVSEILRMIVDFKDEEILSLITSEEHQMIDKSLFVRAVNKFEVAAESRIDIAACLKGANFQLPGREARRMLNGGFLNALNHINLFAVTAILQNREKLNDFMIRISKLNKKSENARAAIKHTIKTLSEISIPNQTSQIDADEEEDYVENICSDLAHSLEALQQHDLDISAIEEDIMSTSHDILLLYAGTSGIEKDEVIQKCESVFVKLKAVLDPIIQPSSNDVIEQIRILQCHDQRSKELFQAIEDSNFNINFGDHSEYFHGLCSSQHIARECIYLLSNYGIHLADLNCETNEHLNKVLKGILVRLQAFANLKLGVYVCDGEIDYSILNHLGYVLQEHMIKFYHNFDTLLPRKGPTHCGICNELYHNAAGCQKECPYCGKKYFKGHRAADCNKKLAL